MPRPLNNVLSSLACFTTQKHENKPNTPSTTTTICTSHFCFSNMANEAIITSRINSLLIEELAGFEVRVWRNGDSRILQISPERTDECFLHSGKPFQPVQDF